MINISRNRLVVKSVEELQHSFRLELVNEGSKLDGFEIDDYYVFVESKYKKASGIWKFGNITDAITLLKKKAKLKSGYIALGVNYTDSSPIGVGSMDVVKIAQDSVLDLVPRGFKGE